jgi:hypothetical protein
VYNIQKAVSRLEYAPKLKEIEVTDIKKGLGVFTPRPDKPVSFAALKATLKNAGYVLGAADITVAGTLDKEGDRWILNVKSSGQKFVLEGAGVETVVAKPEVGSAIEITGDWKTVGQGASSKRGCHADLTHPGSQDRSRGATGTGEGVLASSEARSSRGR